MKRLLNTLVLISVCHLTFADKVFVNNVNDSGTGSLRDAIVYTNANAGADTILLNPLVSGSTITLTSAMEDITDDSTYILLDINLDGLPNLGMDGSGLSSGEHGFFVLGSNVHINGIAIMGFPGNGIYYNGSTYSSLTSTFIGTNLSGTSANGNGSQGIYINNSDSVAIGLNTFGNVISGNGSDGIYINSSDYVSISGNIIGLDVDGNSAISNSGNGIQINASNSILIGNSLTGGRNIISSNTVCGILGNSGSLVNVTNNYIGTDISGSIDMGNAIAGITTFAPTSYWFIGNTLTTGNLVSGNNQLGLDIHGSYHVIANNIIGLDASATNVLSNGATGIRIDASQNVIRENTISGSSTQGLLIANTSSVNNLLRANSIYNNNIGINLTGGSQNGVLPPTITNLDADSIVTGTSSPFALVQLFADADHEGRLFIDSLYADISGNWSYKLSSADLMSAQNLSLDSITAIQDDFGHSSAFSTPYSITVPTVTVHTEEEEVIKVKCYPNPVNDRLYLSNSSEGKISWSILDVLGNKIESGILYSSTSIDMTTYLSGIYIVEISYNQQREIFRIIKE